VTICRTEVWRRHSSHLLTARGDLINTGRPVRSMSKLPTPVDDERFVDLERDAAWGWRE